MDRSNESADLSWNRVYSPRSALSRPRALALEASIATTLMSAEAVATLIPTNTEAGTAPALPAAMTETDAHTIAASAATPSPGAAPHPDATASRFPVFFERDSAALTPEAERLLATVARTLSAADEGTTLQIIAYAADAPTEREQHALGTARAASVWAALQYFGSERIGAMKPVILAVSGPPHWEAGIPKGLHLLGQRVDVVMIETRPGVVAFNSHGIPHGRHPNHG